MKRALLLLAIVSAAGFAKADAIDDWIKAAMEKDKIPGVAFAVINPKGEADVRVFGMADLEASTPYSRKTVHRVASISKQFCAYAVLSLVKEGKVSLSDPLRKFFPKGPAEWDKITVAHALSHRSGIADPGAAFNYSKEYTTDEYVALLAAKPLAEEPGTTYRYNNFAYGLLGLLVGVASGEPLEAYVKRRLFDPLGMSATAYWDPARSRENLSVGYRFQDGKYTRPLVARPKVFHGSGGILSTIDDLVRYEMELRKPSVLDPEILKQQWTVFGGGQRGYGFGWQVNRTSGKLVVSHTGGTFGFTSMLFREVDEGWTLILFRNGQGTEVAAWSEALLKLAKEQAKP